MVLSLLMIWSRSCQLFGPCFHPHQLYSQLKSTWRMRRVRYAYLHKLDAFEDGFNLFSGFSGAFLSQQFTYLAKFVPFFFPLMFRPQFLCVVWMCFGNIMCFNCISLTVDLKMLTSSGLTLLSNKFNPYWETCFRYSSSSENIPNTNWSAENSGSFSSAFIFCTRILLLDNSKMSDKHPCQVVVLSWKTPCTSLCTNCSNEVAYHIDFHCIDPYMHTSKSCFHFFSSSWK